jgi:RNA polymerase subunit RPABC4/transcription elongation factor Spt4
VSITLPANLNVYVSAALFVLGAYLFALYLGLVVWTFKDVHARSRDVLAQIMSTLLVLLFTVPGWLVYLLLRPRTTLADEYERNLAEEAMLQDLDEQRLCPRCQRHVEPDFTLCPSCHHELRVHCAGCDRLLHPEWDICPYCGVERIVEPSRKKRGTAESTAQPLATEAEVSAEPNP